jgi:N-hydroxyarylamine O-acetyltransferase
VTETDRLPGGDEWEVGRLDLDGYLRRIGHRPVSGRSGAVLAGLHRAHIAAIPFENLDIVLGRGISVGLEHVQAKLVGRARGGYCYEHGLLFAAVLERLGFGVERRLARIAGRGGRPRARTHLTLVVQAADGRWLADVGFGSGLLAPLPLRPGGPWQQGDWRYSLRPVGPRAWRLEQHEDEQPTALFEVDDAVQHAADVRIANHFSSTVATSPFVGRVLAVRKDERRVVRLLGRELTVTRPRRPAVRRELTDAEVAGALFEEFGLTLTRDELAALTASLPAAKAAR